MLPIIVRRYRLFIFSFIFFIWLLQILLVLVASAVTSATMLTQNAAIQQVTNYSTGYIRREYSEVKEEGILFVQAEVHAIGVCFASVDASPSAEPTAEPTALPTAFATAAASLPASLLPLSLPSAAPSITPTSASGNDPIVYRQLLSASIDSTRQVVNLFYTEFAEPSCTTPLRSFTTQLPAQESIETVNNVELAVDTQYVLDFEAATAMPAAVPGFAFSFYGADGECLGDAYKYLVATDQCSNYPDYFGKVVCKSNGLKLLFYEYPFSAAGTCEGKGNKVKKQKAECSNQGTAEQPDYQRAECF